MRRGSSPKGTLLGSSALAAISLNFIAASAFSESFEIQPLPVTAGQAPSPTPPPPEAPAIPPAETAQASPFQGTVLPDITVTAPRPKPRAVPTFRPVPAPVTPTTIVAQPVPTPYETGAPNVGGGTAAPPQLASQMTVSGQDLNARPMTNPGEVVEAAPGLIAIEHSDGGKANQYYLRGWNLDHGTDLATFVDDVPINLPTHAHGQGYTDLNWLIPETVGSEEIRKGPYFADVGDFENAGNLHIALRDSVDQNIVSVTAGSFGYMRYLALGSTKLDDGGSLLYAGQFNTYNGPWTNPDDVRRFSGLLRYSQGTATDGFTVTGMAFANDWNAPNQVALRAMSTGQIGLYGQQSPTDGGDTSRFSLSARVAQSEADGSWKANVYAVKYTMDLFNDYGWYTDDPIYGDQFHQHDDRFYTGGGVSRTTNGTLLDRQTETEVGVQTRYDDITTGLSDTYQRQLLTNVLLDHVNEGNAAIYAQNTMHWTDWFKSTLGWRGDAYMASVDSTLQPANSGKVETAIGSPKATAVVGPFYKTELFFGAGMGYHTNDARGAIATQVPGDPAAPQTPTPFLARSRGGEVGIRSKIIPGLDSSISTFYIHQDSELFFDGDTGTTTAGLPSQRTGIEITNDYRPASWVHIDANLALTRARFLGFDETQNALYQSLAGYPQAQIGNAPGNFIYNAPWMVASGGITLGEKTGWFSSLRWRYFSSRPLTEDGVFQSPPFNVINGTVGYRFENGWRVQLDALNLLNSTTDQATYAYGSLLTSDALFALCNPASGHSSVPAAVCQNGVMDYVYHPLEPLAFRLTLAGPIETMNVPAMTAELKQAIPAYEPPGINYDWSGFHVGARVDSTSSKVNGSAINTATGAAVEPGDLNPMPWHGGIQLGYDYMFPSRLVLGIEGDVSSGGRKTTTITDASGISSIESNVFDSETLRARVGYAANNILLYGTAGAAWSSNQYIRTQLTGTLNLATAGTDEADNKYLSGLVAGGGLAFAFAKNWNAFVEYRYTDYGSSTTSLPFSQVSTTSKTEVSEVDFGINYKFDWSARYNTGSGAIAKPAPSYKAPSDPGRYNWTGFHVGIDGGYGWATSSGSLTDATGVALTPYNYSVSGPFAGTFVGGDYQFGRFVLGAEGDWQWGNLTGNNQAGSPITAPTGTFPGFLASTTTKDYGSIRGRFGIALDRFLVFGTAGWAWGNPSTSYALLGSGPFATNGGNLINGWTAGAGVDYALTKNVSARIEYRYSDLGTSSLLNAPTNSGEVGNKVPISDVRVGFAFKFGT
jgi:opacity protein-like surface antigen/outer membrane receptor protein involved in Fe transport